MSIFVLRMKQILAVHEHEVKKVKLGQPQQKQQVDAFLEVAGFLEENDDEQITLHDLIQRMEENLVDSKRSAYNYVSTYAAKAQGTLWRYDYSDRYQWQV